MNCPICSFESRRGSKKRSNFSGYIPCYNCHSLYSVVIPTSKELFDYYLNYYDSSNLVIPQIALDSINRTVLSFDAYRTQSNSICDFGYGAGALLAASENHGWNCAGTEYSPSSIALGRERNWDVHEGDLTESDLMGPFDVITIVETIEHVIDPNNLLRQAHSRLRSGGMLYGTTPNSRSLNARILKSKWSVITFPEHPILFSVTGMSRILFENGFDVISIKTSGFNPFDLISVAKTKFRKDSEVIDKGRVAFGYSLNQKMNRNRISKTFKSFSIKILNFFKIGDSLIFIARKR